MLFFRESGYFLELKRCELKQPKLFSLWLGGAVSRAQDLTRAGGDNKIIKQQKNDKSRLW